MGSGKVGGTEVVAAAVVWTMVEVVVGAAGMPPYPGRPYGSESDGYLKLLAAEEAEAEERVSTSDRHVANTPSGVACPGRRL
ncbi:hypothetical protein PR202_gb29439 [Eleusine coracana subsp. coracana]|uniref:Secreted protein n=1 Tax=Eleusine coracana subsp. coracana TaxID=191504 RepID=A0AAV5FZV6_ELECO|nr:hypothetical protein PR202_gb29439 [Eleusine coracana subsp. coracana]